MRPQCCLDDPSLQVVLDTSVAINVNASGIAARLLSALPNTCVMTDFVGEELQSGIRKGRNDAVSISKLSVSGLLDTVSLGEEGQRCFETLVSGSSVDTLDDGEASTIAYAYQVGGFALIDEKKAARICSQRFPSLKMGSTVDIFAHAKVQESIVNMELADAVYNALINARMSVLEHHREWIHTLIGPERASRCHSLPRRLRQQG